MIRLLLLFTSMVIGLCLPSTSQAQVKETFVTTVVGVIEPEKSTDTWIFLLSADGRALRVKPEDRSRVALLNAVKGTSRFIEVEMYDRGDYDSIESLIELSGVQSRGPSSGLPIEPIEPSSDSILERVDFEFGDRTLTPDDIYSYFKSFRLRRGSQCFHRAYYWGHQLWRETGVMSHKVFMFFTGRYIRRYNYNWWFHVAPYVYDENGKEVVIDATFLKKPVNLQAWTDNFLRNDPVCPVVPNYLGHHAQERDEWCYVVKTPMWYYHPNVVEQANRTKIPVKKFESDRLVLSKRSR